VRRSQVPDQSGNLETAGRGVLGRGGGDRFERLLLRLDAQHSDHQVATARNAIMRPITPPMP